MRRIKREAGLVSFFLTAATLLAQPAGKITNGINVENFPEISFVYHTDNPDWLNESDFGILTESGKKVDFKIDRIAVSKETTPQHIVVLWEDMSFYGKNQFDATQDILSHFFSVSKIPASDFFAVYAFNRRGNTPSVLIPVTEGFTNDKNAINAAIKNYGHSTVSFPQYPNCSDMYTAVREGLDLLEKQNGKKAIIVFTAGHPMETSGADSEAQVLLKAQQRHIPIYIFQSMARSGVASKTEGFAKSTYGDFKIYSSLNIDKAKTDIQDLYPKIGERYLGHDYKITYVSDAQRGSEARPIMLSVAGIEIQELMTPPSHTLGTWVKANPLWSVLIAVLLIGAFTLLFIFVDKSKKRHRREVADMEARQRQALADVESRRLRDLQEAQEREAQKEREREETRRISEERAVQEKLQQLMLMKNLFPRLKCKVGDTMSTFEISSPVIRIGREMDNDVVLEHQTVSRYHAEIFFNGSSFEVIDKDSTNKVIVNGRIVKSSILKSGDIIGLGQAVITYFC